MIGRLAIVVGAVALPIAGMVGIAVAAPPPDQRIATTAESGGRDAGCVRYTPVIDRTGKHHWLEVTFTNDCGRPVVVSIGSQMGTREGGWSRPRTLKPGETAGPPDAAGTSIGIDWLSRDQRYVVMQAEPVRRIAWPSLAGCKPHPSAKDPPCPPMIRID